jgi:uncharacterized protein
MPPYSYVPGGPWPHPMSAPGGHSTGLPREVAPPIGREGWAASDAYLRGIALFNAGYYWEAHEVWEGLWHAHGRRGPTADVIKGLIKLAAAGVKVREGQPHGVTTHAARAARLFETARAEQGDLQLGLDLGEWIAIARRIAADPPADPGPPGAPVWRVFPFAIEPDEGKDSPQRTQSTQRETEK